MEWWERNNWAYNMAWTETEWWNYREKARHYWDIEDTLVSAQHNNAWVCVVVGILGNLIAAIILLSSKKLWQYTCTLYLLVLAVCDTGCLLATQLSYIQWPEYTTSYWGYAENFIPLKNTSLCKLFWFSYHMLPQLEAWVLVQLALDRVICIGKPLEHDVIFSKKRALLGLAATVCIISSVNAIFFYYPYAHRYDEDRNITWYFDCQWGLYGKQLGPVWPMVDFLLTSALPFILLLITNICTIKFVVDKYKMQCELGVKQKIPVSSTSAMLVGVVVVFFITTAPYRLVQLLNFWYTRDGYWAVFHSIKWDLFTARYVTQMMLPWNFVLNFYLYCLTNKEFREAFLSKFEWCPKPQ